jgi:hypothetical protein
MLRLSSCVPTRPPEYSSSYTTSTRSARQPIVTISCLTVHRFIISAVFLSSKSYCDAFCTNARLSGIAPAEFACLERAFLAAIDWRLTYICEAVQHSPKSTLSRTPAADPTSSRPPPTRRLLPRLLLPEPPLRLLRRRIPRMLPTPNQSPLL